VHDRYTANSQVTQERISAYFERDSRIVYPPVDTPRFDDGAIDPQDCLRNGARFDPPSLRAGILGEVEAAQSGSRPGGGTRQPLGSTRLMALAAQGTRR
jgi:hypothetical protein